MAVQLINTVPQAGDPANGISATSQWRIDTILLHRGWIVNGTIFTPDPVSSIVVVKLIGEYGRTRDWYYKRVTADNLLLALNKANLSAGQPLEWRTLNQLITDLSETGTLTGAAD